VFGDHLPEQGDGLTEAQRTGAVLFDQLWQTLTDVLGDAATAALLRRSAKRALGRQPQLSALEISRVGFEYKYRLPPDWTTSGHHAVQDLARELCPLLIELTDDVVVRRVVRIPGLQMVASPRTKVEP
jgi:hypothetical protein